MIRTIRKEIKLDKELRSRIEWANEIGREELKNVYENIMNMDNCSS